MNAVEELIVDLFASLPTDAGGESVGVAVAVTELALTIPIESRVAGAGLYATLPRSRMITGFEPQYGRLSAVFGRTE